MYRVPRPERFSLQDQPVQKFNRQGFAALAQIAFHLLPASRFNQGIMASADCLQLLKPLPDALIVPVYVLKKAKQRHALGVIEQGIVELRENIAHGEGRADVMIPLQLLIRRVVRQLAQVFQPPQAALDEIIPR
ncbi:hypothetical protein SDC9_166555 [bioreactor metagenome]|uniref:Uncharacterized protein n=1 Tax=bioreactor metagenome TaxID=1076179 RepID=A0A645FZY7_9ZZZZ